jgi:hypothetical protein
MSRRTFWQGPYEIVAGWDRPLQHFFLDVYDHTTPVREDEDEVLLYSSLYEPPGVYERYTLEQIKATLRTHRITPPPTFYDDLQDDAQANIGNLTVTYHSTGGEHDGTNAEARTPNL